MDIYENIVVGNFLFGLGVKLGIQHQSSPVKPISINLLQQQPLDRPLGDVVIANARILRLVEFKREGNKDKKEKLKWKLLSDALETEDIIDLTSISRKIHWYVNSDYRAKTIGNDSNIKICPYLDFYNSNIFINLTEFINKTAEEAYTETMSDEEMKWCKIYLEIVASIFGSASGKSGCLLLTVSGSGQLTYAAVDDIGDFIETRQAVLDRHLEQQIQLAREQELQYERSIRVKEREIEREGPSLDF